MEYFVADSYKDAQWIGEPFENSKGKMVVKIKYACKRCGGSGHYMYNQLDGTKCYGCMGSGIQTDIVRAYTAKEKAAMDRAAVRRVERKAQEEQEKLQRNLANKDQLMKAFFEKHGFNEDGETFVVLGDSYSIKDELKEKGFKYDPILKWHGPAAASYKTVKFTFDDIYTWNDKYANGNYKETCYELIAERIKSAEISEGNGDFIGEVKERLRKLEVKLISRYESHSAYGFSECLNFDDANNHHFTWWTGTCPQINVGDTIILTGTVKAHDTYKGKNITVLTRCKLEKEA